WTWFPLGYERPSLETIAAMAQASRRPRRNIPSAFQLFAPHFQRQPFFFHGGELGLGQGQAARGGIEGGAVAGEEIRVGESRLQSCDLRVGGLHAARQRLERVVLLEGEAFRAS